MASHPPEVSAPLASTTNPATLSVWLGKIWKFAVPVAIGLVLWFLPVPS